MKTVSLELSKQLKEAGYGWKVSFLWEVGLDGIENLVKRYPANESDMERIFPAPIADEILDLLPNKIYEKEEDNWFYLTIHKNSDPEDHYEGWEIRYKEANGNLVFLIEQEVLLADAAAKMWLYLKKENLI